MNDDRTPHRPSVPLSEVARLLGVSADALRKRAERGRLPGAVRVDGRWYAPRPDADDRPDAPAAPPPAALVPSDRTGSGSVTTGQAEATLAELRAIRVALDRLTDALLSGRDRTPDSASVAENGAVAAQDGPEAADAAAGPSRPWWRRWWWGIL